MQLLKILPIFILFNLSFSSMYGDKYKNNTAKKDDFQFVKRVVIKEYPTAGAQPVERIYENTTFTA